MVGRAQRMLAEKHHDPVFWPGGEEMMRDPSAAYAAKARIFAQRELVQGLQRWAERLVFEQFLEGMYKIDELDCSLVLPEQSEILMTAAVSAATRFLFQDAFWQTEV